MTTASIDYYGMFFLGLLGTGHCIGMCGPLVLVFPGRSRKFLPHLLYHAGRIVTYTAVGALMGGVGAGVTRAAAAAGADPLVWVARIQVSFSLAAAAFLLIFGLTRIGLLPEPRWMAVADPQRLPGYRNVIHSALAEPTPIGMGLTGMLFGFLPCGLSYAAFARALAAGSVAPAALLVAVFGLGTVPGLLLLGTTASQAARRYRRQSDLLAGVLMIGMAAALAADAVGAIAGSTG